MPRSLVRFVFPPFALRLVVVVAIMAVGIFLFARSYRIETQLLHLERASALVEAALRADPAETVRGHLAVLDTISRSTGLGIAILDADGHSIVESSPRVAATARAELAALSDAGLVRIYPGASTGDYLAILRNISVPGWPEAHAIAVGIGLTGLERNLASLGGWLAAMVASIVVVVLAISYRIVKGIRGPLGTLEHAAMQFADGRLDYRCALPEPVEFSRLAETMNSMASQLTARIEALRSQRRQLEAILESMVEGVILVNDQFRISSMNTAARSLFAVAELETRLGEPRALLEVIRNSELFKLVKRTLESRVRQDGRIVIYSNPARHMQVHGTFLEIGDAPHVLVVLNDISRLQHLEQVRKEFVANVSHELKTPITSILGFVETLKDGALDDPDEAHRFLDIIENHSARLNAIIEDLLQLSRLEQNREAVPRTEARAEDIVEAVRRLIDAGAAEKGIRIHETYRGNTTISVAPSLLEQALANLLDNAVKYCPDGSTVEIAFFREPGAAVFEVRDDGPGIPIQDQPRLFERFFRVDKARSRTLGGTGLGLAIVKHIVQAHGGTVAVESTPGAGARFRVTLPMESNADDGG